MVKYVIKRLLLTVLVIVGAAVLIFCVMYLVPGDPAEILAGAGASPSEVAALRARMGLDKSFLAQFGDFMYNTFIKFDLGTSWVYGTSVWSGIAERLPRTLILGFITAIVCVIVGIPLGVTAATHHGKWQDRGLIVGSMVFVSIPEFWLALMLILFFNVQLGWLPAFGCDSWLCYILPVISGSLTGICNIARQSRASVLDVVRADFVTTARAKGMSERSVIYKHMLPNALIPIITVSGNYFARCIGGTIVIEKIFSFPGIGLYLNDAISMRDYPAVRGCVIIMAAFTSIMMLIVDLAYGFADPRIKSQYVASSASKKKTPDKNERHRSHNGGRHSGGHGRRRGHFHQDDETSGKTGESVTEATSYTAEHGAGGERHDSQ